VRRCVLVVILAGLAAIFAPPALAERPAGWEDPPDCASPTIPGTPMDDTLVGTPGDDVIDGHAGDDTIDGMGGEDVMCGGAGADTITDPDCGNEVAAGYGDDTVTVRNTCTPRSGEKVWDGPGGDVVRTGFGNDYIYGGSGDDRVWTGNSSDDLYDGPGDDVYRGEERPDFLILYRPGGFDRYFGGGWGDWVALGDYPRGVTARLATGSWNIPGKRVSFGGMS
jgi:Ca2+-binding RTX toxin-like protein